VAVNYWQDTVVEHTAGAAVNRCSWTEVQYVVVDSGQVLGLLAA
jgi:hypothetical protein